MEQPPRRPPEPFRRPFADWVESHFDRLQVWYERSGWVGFVALFAGMSGMTSLIRLPAMGIGLLSAAALLVTVYELIRRFSERRRASVPSEHRCANCDYDLRATPELCPECGTPAKPPRGWKSKHVPQDSPWLDPAAAKLTPKPPKRTFWRPRRRV